MRWALTIVALGFLTLFLLLPLVTVFVEAMADGFAAYLAAIREPDAIAALTLTVLAAAIAAACGEEGLLPTTVDPGPDFNVSQVLFDENFYYCQIEPMLFAQGCGPGNAAEGDPSNGCHHSVTS